MTVKIAARWFSHRTITDEITLFWEPYVARLLCSNIWHVKGRDSDLLVDTGLGIASLKEAAVEVFDKPIIAIATHTHLDHVGGMYEFENRVVHRCEANSLAAGNPNASLITYARDSEYVRKMEEAGYHIPDEYLQAYPSKGYDVMAYSVNPAPATRIVDEGDRIDLGNRHFEVLHLPGHSPGSIGLWEKASGTLFSGDALYDGPLLDFLPGSNVADYMNTMERLKSLPVRVVHGGHDASFGRDRLHELADAYLNKRGFSPT